MTRSKIRMMRADDVPAVARFGIMNEDEILKVVTDSSRQFVAVEGEKVVGGLVFDLEPNGYQIRLIAASSNEARDTMIRQMLRRNDASEKRAKIQATVPDGDYETIRSLQDQGFEVALVPGGWDGTRDSWRCVRVQSRKKTTVVE